MNRDVQELERSARAKKRAIEFACAFTDAHYDESVGLVRTLVGTTEYSEHQTVYGAMAYLQSGDPERVARANRILGRLNTLKDRFALNAVVLTMLKLHHMIEPAVREKLRELLRDFLDVPAEDIVAGRNTNLPLQTWTARIAAGLWFNRPDVVDRAYAALEQLTQLVKDHGTIPEFNSPVYHGVTLAMLRTICLLGESRTSALAARLEKHLWDEVALRFHPTLRILGGPWSRIYHDGLVGAASLLTVLLDMVWGAFYDPGVAELYEHGFEMNCGGLFASFADECPCRPELALQKRLPLTVISRAEQVDYRLGTDWVPGGVAELTTWMDERLCVGTATRSHGHGMQNATYYAAWTRTGQPVERLDDLGVAFTRFIQNGRRPGERQYKYRNHFNGYTMVINSCYWADDGRPFAVQSGPTALIVYVPKGQERLYVRSLEVMLVCPRVDTVDAVLVDGRPVDPKGYEGNPAASVVVRSGAASLGLRFCAVDPSLTQPKLHVETCRDHLFVGLELVAFPHERELPESEYRLYGASIGAELRWTPDAASVHRLIEDMGASELTDSWWMGDPPHACGGPRKVSFQVGSKRLEGRFAPVAETWLSRNVPRPEGEIRQIRFE